MEPSRKERNGKEKEELDYLKKYLFNKAMKGRWKEVVEKYATDSRAREAKITKRGDTVLHVAVSDGQVGVVEELMRIISGEEKKGGDESNSKRVVRIANNKSATALHLAATLGNVKMCYDIASVDHSLVGVRNNEGETPLFLAALHGNKDAFLCIHSFCAQTTVHCRRTIDGQTILHCAIMGDFFELALHIIKLYKELVNFVNEQGYTPLHLLATKPSAFKSGTHLGRWKMIVYHCIFVDEVKIDPKSFLRALPTKPLSLHRRSNPNNEKLYPPNYTTCANLFNFLWKGIRMGQDLWDVVGDTKVNPLKEIVALKNWNVKAESRIRRVIIYGLKPKQKNFVAPVQGWETTESTVVTSHVESISEEEWEKKEMLVIHAEEYKKNQVIVTANISKLSIVHISKTMITPHPNSNHVELENVSYVPRVKKNLVSVSQLTSIGNFSVFRPDDVKVYHNLKVSDTSLLEGQRMDFIYAMLVEVAYVNKTQKNETTDF
ncbi:hypothetical protein Csa_004446 [Cucumis sativus]|nr:hypothetical protein Csa_004446 [Cucumis sativus]